jgi:glycogen operon protein
VQLESGPNDGLAVKRLFVILNAHFQTQWVKLPPLDSSLAWHRAIDTSLPAGQDISDAGSEIRLDPADHYIANARSTVVLLAQ